MDAAHSRSRFRWVVCKHLTLSPFSLSLVEFSGNVWTCWGFFRIQTVLLLSVRTGRPPPHQDRGFLFSLGKEAQLAKREPCRENGTIWAVFFFPLLQRIPLSRLLSLLPQAWRGYHYPLPYPERGASPTAGLCLHCLHMLLGNHVLKSSDKVALLFPVALVQRGRLAAL